MPYDPLAAPTKLENVTRRADHSSICPVCHIYIARNWSLIARLPGRLRVYCRDRNGNPGFACNDYTRSGHRRTHGIKESAWVHARCYETGLEVFAVRLFSIPGRTQTIRQAAKEIDTLLLSARPPGSIDWGDEEDWAPDHD